MKYSIEIIIELPRQEVINKLDSVENIKHWQRGLVTAEHISGTPGEVGAKMKLIYKFGKRELEMTETITRNDFPEAFSATYDTRGMRNLQENTFEETSEGRTIWASKNEFIPSSFALRIMTILMPRAFKKQTRRYLIDFKNFAERGTSVANKN
ncbi:MAG: SRPBCC family protein [Bacteroidia bacterium]|nr:SRPBCC family protein [Bacteroidia bacterium]